MWSELLQNHTVVETEVIRAKRCNSFLSALELDSTCPLIDASLSRQKRQGNRWRSSVTCDCTDFAEEGHLCKVCRQPLENTEPLLAYFVNQVLWPFRNSKICRNIPVNVKVLRVVDAMVDQHEVRVQVLAT